ncbi:hypothetical protein PFISCL1PPCAC_1201, partial [Pristionchus fissidentatus]
MANARLQTVVLVLNIIQLVFCVMFIVGGMMGRAYGFSTSFFTLLIAIFGICGVQCKNICLLVTHIVILV